MVPGDGQGAAEALQAHRFSGRSAEHNISIKNTSQPASDGRKERALTPGAEKISRAQPLPFSSLLPARVLSSPKGNVLVP